MLIRSQNKCRLINFDSLPAIEIMEIEGDVRVICSDTYETFDIGKYSSEKKALEVLNMIEEAYINGHIGFQMPADSDVVE